MPSNLLREEHIKQLIKQLCALEVAEGQRLIAKWESEVKPNAWPYRKTLARGS